MPNLRRASGQRPGGVVTGLGEGEHLLAALYRDLHRDVSRGAKAIEAEPLGFAGHGDGSWPRAGLVALNGTLYGTTEFGGGYSNGNCLSDCGTVFQITQ